MMMGYERWTDDDGTNERTDDVWWNSLRTNSLGLHNHPTNRSPIRLYHDHALELYTTDRNMTN
jgi:hypothetical protein